MPPTKKPKLDKANELTSRTTRESNGDIEMGHAEAEPETSSEVLSSEDVGSSHSAVSGSPDTEAEIELAQLSKRKSKKTTKRKLRATSPLRFGNTLEELLNTSVNAEGPLALKPSIQRQIKREKELFEKRKKSIVEKKEHEEIGRIEDVIGGWGGESERALRKVAQRGVVQLFNVIQKAQTAKLSEEKEKLALRGSGKPTLEAPKFHSKGKKKAIITTTKEETVDKDVFMDAIRAGGVVSRV